MITDGQMNKDYQACLYFIGGMYEFTRFLGKKTENLFCCDNSFPYVRDFYHRSYN